jgi:diguanylate cyclase (GGDEF)-like protein/PAS domain S-box-containing protein
MTPSDLTTSRLDSIADPRTLLAGLFEHSPVAFQVYRADGHSLLVNQAFRELFQSEPPPEYNILLDPLAAETGQAALVRRAFAGETISLPPFWFDPRERTVIDQREGRRVAIELTMFPLFDAGGAISHVAVCLRNATAEMELATSERQLQGLYDAMACGVVVLAADGRVLRSNPAAEAILGLTGAELRSELLWTLCQPVEADGSPLDAESDPVTLALHDNRVVRRRTLGIIRHREQRWLEMDLVPTRSTGGDVRLVLSFLDVTDRKQAEASLNYQALHDGLTMLPNRTLLLDRLNQASLAAVREDQPLALLLVNLDRFKDVNETLGREAGDRLLQETAGRLQASIRTSDTVARLGADEFAVVLPTTELAGACLVAEQIVSALGQRASLNGSEIEVGASIGIAMFPEHGTDAEGLLRHADGAMLRAKSEHGGYAVYSPDHESLGAKRLIMMSGLRRAIDNDELTLAYQPKIYCRSGQLVGVEGLVRWQHAELGMIPPDDFIGLAEQTGLIKALTRWVLNAALRQCHAWQQDGLRVPVAVNLSAHDVQDPGLPVLVASLLSTWNVPATCLKVELTESALLAEPLRAMLILKQLTDSGVGVSIDDFGTGYSSLAYLKRLPINEIKIDRGFVSEMRSDRKDLAIVRSTIELGHNLGFEVVAEGVEDQTTLDVLESLGCDVAQGYFVSRPMPPSELARWCRETGRWNRPEAAQAVA